MLKFGLAHPVTNNRFNICSKLTTTAYYGKADSITVVVPGGAPADLDRFFGTIYGSSSKQTIGRVNKCILGPSTHTANVGAVEVLNVIQVSSSNIISFEKPIAYLYNTGNPVTMIGAGLPGGWVGTWIGSGHNDFSYGSILKTDGYSDQYGFDVYSIVGGGFNYAVLEMPLLMANTYYRLEIKYRSVNLSGGSARLSIYEGNRSFNSSSSIDLPHSTNWNSLYSVFKTVANQTLTPVIMLYFPGGRTADKFEVANISLTHASHDLSKYSSTGVSEISEFPDRGSIKINRMTESMKLGENFRGDKFTSTVLENIVLPVARYRIGYSMSYVSDRKSVV